jgi:hypothetical protein
MRAVAVTQRGFKRNRDCGSSDIGDLHGQAEYWRSDAATQASRS